MSRLRRLALAVPAGLLTLFAGITALVLVLRTNPHVRRAEKLLLTDDLEGAQTELRTALAQGVGDPRTKALLLYALLEGQGSGAADADAPSVPASLPAGSSLAAFDDTSVTGLLEDAGRLRFAAIGAWPSDHPPAGLKDAEAGFERSLQALRRDLATKGIPTSGAKELYAISHELARYVLDRSARQRGSEDATGGEERLAAAYALADAPSGDPAAMALLTGALDGKQAEIAERLLVKVGPPAAAALVAVANDHDALGRERAIEALSLVGVADAAAIVFQLEPKARACQLDDLPEPLRTDVFKRRLGDRFSRNSSRLYLAARADLELPLAPELGSLFFSLGAPEDGLLALYGCDADKEGAFTYLFHFDGQHYGPLKIARDSRTVSDLEGAAPVLQLTAGHGASGPRGVELWQAAVVPTSVEKPTPLHGRPKVGDRVWVSSIQIGGKVDSVSAAPPDDGGGGDETYTLTLDSPYDGTTTFPNAYEYDLEGLHGEEEQLAGYEVLSATISGDVLGIAPGPPRYERLPAATPPVPKDPPPPRLPEPSDGVVE